MHELFNNISHCVKSDIFFNPIFVPGFSGSRFFGVQVFQGVGPEPGSRVQGSGPGSESRVQGPNRGCRVRVQLLEVAVVLDSFNSVHFYFKV